MNFSKLTYDEQIEKSIKYSFKTCKEISEDTGLDYQIVSRRLRQFRKENIVFFQEAKNKNRSGVVPMKYKMKI